MSFTYLSANQTNRVECDLDCRRCTAINAKNGQQCKRTTCKHLPFCTTHLKSQMHLTVKKSIKIPEAGFGLFSYGKKENDIVFKKNDKIADYFGNLYTKAENDELYGSARNDVAPYTYKTSANKYLDSACTRSTAAFANDNRGNANAQFKNDTSRGKVTLRAKKNIRNNEEIFVSYGPTYFHDVANEPKPTYKTLTRKRGKKFPAFLK
jgi:hypothetical protein